MFSAWQLAEMLNRNLLVYWPIESEMPLSYREVFDSAPASAGKSLNVQPLDSLPWPVGDSPYLTENVKAQLVTLRGLDRGEQVFASEFLTILQRNPRYAIFIGAGGLFDFSKNAGTKLMELENISFASRGNFIGHFNFLPASNPSLIGYVLSSHMSAFMSEKEIGSTSLRATHK